MRAQGNGTPQICAANLLRTVRGEVPYDRLRGRDGTLIDRSNVTDAAEIDIELVLNTYEPRMKTEKIGLGSSATIVSGNFNITVNVAESKEGEKIK